MPLKRVYYLSVFFGVRKIIIKIIMGKLKFPISLTPHLSTQQRHQQLAMLKCFFHTPPYKIDAWFRRLQFCSAALVSLGHGGNDAQKTMGIIAVLLFSTGLVKGE